MGVRRAIDDYLDIVGHDCAAEPIQTPDLTIDGLAASGVPFVDPCTFAASLEEIAPRRRALNQLVAAEGSPLRAPNIHPPSDSTTSG